MFLKPPRLYQDFALTMSRWFGREGRADKILKISETKTDRLTFISYYFNPSSIKISWDHQGCLNDVDVDLSFSLFANSKPWAR